MRNSTNVISVIMGDDVDVENNDEYIRPHILYMSICCILTIGINGMVLSALGSNLTNIADVIGVNSMNLSWKALMFRGIGTVFGSSTSSHIFRWHQREYILLCCLLGTALLLVLIPLSIAPCQAHVYFFGLGICSAVNDTGYDMMMKKLYGKKVSHMFLFHECLR
jgi:predicted MFS family arabinose efflux permease